MLPDNLVAIILISELFVLALLSWQVVKGAKKHPPQMTPPPPIPPEWALRQSEKIIGSAEKKAEAIITEAEVEGIKLETQAKLSGQDFERLYKQSINQSVKLAAEQLTDSLGKTQTTFQEFIKQLEQRSDNSERQLQELIKQRVGEILFNLEQSITSFLSTSQQKSIEAVNLELKSAHSLIDTYRSQQLALIDENIVAVLERTLSLVLHNNLSLKDQVDLVYEALEKAKVEKFFA